MYINLGRISFTSPNQTAADRQVKKKKRRKAVGVIALNPTKAVCQVPDQQGTEE